MEARVTGAHGTFHPPGSRTRYHLHIQLGEGISSPCQLSYITEVFFLARTEPVFPPEEQQHLIKPPSPLLWSLASGRLGPILQEGPGEAEPCAAYSCCSSAQRWQHFTGGQRRAWDTVGTFILLSALGAFRPKAVCKIKVIRCLGFSKSQRNSGLLWLGTLQPRAVP